MLARAARAAARRPRPAVAGAEEIPLADRSVDVVVAAQAFHWFDHDGRCRRSPGCSSPAATSRWRGTPATSGSRGCASSARSSAPQEQPTSSSPSSLVRSTLFGFVEDDDVPRSGRTSTATRSSRPGRCPGPTSPTLDEAERGRRSWPRCSRSTTTTAAAWTACSCPTSAACFRAVVVDRATRRRAPATERRPTPTTRRADRAAQRRHRHRHAAHRLPLSDAADSTRPSRASGMTRERLRTAPYPPRHRGRPRHLPHPAHRLARLARAARGADRGQRRAQHPPPARPARHPGGRAHRHQRRCSPGTALGSHHADQAPRAAPRRPSSTARTRVADRGELRLRRRRLPGPARGRQPAGRRGPGRRHPPGRSDRPATGRPGPRRRRGRRSGSPASSSSPSSTRRGTRLMEAEVRALRAQISPHFIYNSLGAIASLRAHRPRPGPRAAAGVRRLHPLLVPPARRVHDAGRGAALGRALPAARAGPLRRPAPGHAADRARGAAGRRAVPVHPAAGRERRPPRARGAPTAAARPHHDRRPRPRPGVRDRGRGRRRRRGPRAGTPGARRRRRRSTRSGSATSTRGCATPSATTTAWSWRPRPAPAPRSSSGCPSSPRGCTHEHRTPLLRVLVIDDERPALDELAFLLERDAAGRRRCSPATPPPRRCGCSRTLDVDAVFLDIQMPGLTGLDLAQVLARFKHAAADRVRDRPRGARGRRLRAATRSTTCSSRCARSGSPRRYAAWSRAAAAPAGERRADPGRARRGDPVRQPLRHHATSRRRATTPGCTPPTAPTCSAPR